MPTSPPTPFAILAAVGVVLIMGMILLCMGLFMILHYQGRCAINRRDASYYRRTLATTEELTRQLEAAMLQSAGGEEASVRIDEVGTDAASSQDE